MTENGELITILMLHAKKYPLMQPQDVVKLIYQNEFGSGHFISDPESSLNRLAEEAAAVKTDESIPLFESIGNGVRRVYLTSADIKGYPLPRLNEDFVRLSQQHTGSRESLENKLAAVEERFALFGFCFSRKEFSAFAADYKNRGCPPVSHSEAYRSAYHPAYRLTRERELS